MDDPVERAIAGYRAELAANAAIGADEADELEDHLRTLIAELRGAGANTQAAIAAARARLGAPAAIATECARVRTAFGTRLDRGRTYAAGAILAVLATWAIVMVLPHIGVLSRFGAESGFALILIAGLFARRTWPRAVLFGFSAMSAVTFTLFNAMWPGDVGMQLAVVSFVALAMLLAPWRKGELARAGWALALWTMTYAGSWAAFAIVMLRAGQDTHQVAPPATLAGFLVDRVLPASVLIGVFVAGVGTGLRARWGAIVGFGTAAAMAMLAVRVAVVDEGQAWQRVAGIGLAIASTAAAIAAPLLAWRDSRPGKGDPRSLILA
jgi:hypothetical protein